MGDDINVKTFGQKSKKQAQTFSIDKDLLERFKKTVKANGANQSAVVEEFIKFYVEKSESLI